MYTGPMRAVRSNPRTWFKIYVALALTALCIASMSIWLGSTLLTAHRQSVHLHALWAARQNNLAELSTQAARAHRAISAEFDHQHADEALETVRSAVINFDLEFAECLADLHTIAEDDLAALVSENIHKARDAMHEMASQGDGLFHAIEAGDLRSAGVRMARINRAYGEIQNALVPLRPAIRDSLSHALRAQLHQSERLERRQYTIAGLMCIGVILAVWYGRRLFEATAIAQREHEEYLQIMSDRRDAAEAANRAKSEFLANMSHEIRTPMTAILGYADLLTDAGQTTEDRDRCIRTIRRSGEHLLAILNDILDLSRIEAGRMQLESLDCSPIQIAEEVFSLIHPRAVEQGITFRTDFHFPLPLAIKADPLRLKQILLNLVGNAVKFTPRGSVTITLELQPSGSLAFRITDTGIGMPPEKIAILYEPFTQADSSTTRRFGGSGLGLSISRRLAEMMSASIDVQSKPGAGSTFTLALSPDATAQSQMVTSLQQAAPQLSSSPAQPVNLRGRILLAEDGPDNQRLITAFLTRAGAEVHLARNGRQAVDMVLVADDPFDLVIMDMQMPELDGYAATRLLRSRGHRGPILALTAHAMSGERERCLAAGCNDYIAKPIQRQQFLETCRNLIAGLAGSLPATATRADPRAA